MKNNFIGKIPEVLSKTEQNNAFIKYKSGYLEYRNILIEHNIRYVLYIAKKYTTQNEEESDDLISVGTIGLIKAVESFDLNKNILFGTYATRCIENEILMYFRKNQKYKNDNSIEKIIKYDDYNNGLKIIDILESKDESLIDIQTKKESIMEIRKILNELSPQDNLILYLKYGFINDKIYSQSEIGKIIGISQSCISRNINKNLNEMKVKMKRYNEN